jgi:hypothetical protein
MFEDIQIGETWTKIPFYKEKHIMHISTSRIRWAIVGLYSVVSLCIYGQTQTIHNTLKDINACRGRIKLTLVREWGGELPEGNTQVFYLPKDIEIGQDGRVYIADSGNNRILVFDSLGHFQRTIGKKGQAPGEFFDPLDLALDNQNNILVSDFENSRIQILNSSGSYLQSFKLVDKKVSSIAATQEREIVMYNSPTEIKPSYPLFLYYLYNYAGKMVGEIGRRKLSKYTSVYTLESTFFTLDEHDNVYAAYYCTPLLEKYSKTGQLMLTATFEMPFKVPEIKLHSIGADINVRAERVAAGLSIDNKGQLYVVTTTRPKMPDEKEVSTITSIVTKTGEAVILPKERVDIKSTTDLYRLLVFNSLGKIIAAEPLSVFCDNIKVHRDRLFVIDTNATMKIYEYRIRFN